MDIFCSIYYAQMCALLLLLLLLLLLFSSFIIKIQADIMKIVKLNATGEFNRYVCTLLYSFFFLFQCTSNVVSTCIM